MLPGELSAFASRTMISRRSLIIAPLLVGASIRPAGGQSFPSATIRIVVPAAPGGGTDILARAMGPHLHALWGQPVIVDNRSGAAGLIGTKYVVAAPGDGHTLLMAATSAIMSLAATRPLPFDISRDLAPVTLVSAPPYILVAHPSVPAKTAAELIAYAKENPGKLSYGSSGAGAASHLSGALFAQMAGIEMLHVPYRGMGQAVPDLLGGRIQLLFAPAITVRSHIAAGTLRMIGTTGAARSTLFPDFPTIAESGLAKYESLGWFGLFAPGATAAAVVRRISDDARKVLVSAELKKRLADQGAEPAPTTPDEFKTFVNTDINKWYALAKAANIKLGG
jgi:tripartite-type tricarboxylate transporter receptor subunit TctC